jgi:glycosyltransferase involved in cell wall biosynthesis
MKVAWMHPYLSTWLGGTRFIYEVSRRLKKKCDIEIIVETISSDLREKFENEGMRVTEVSELSTYSMKYWTFFPLYVRKTLKNCREKITRDKFDVLIASFFPMNWVVAQFNLMSVYLCFEPFPWFHDPLVINSFPFFKRQLLKLAKALYLHYDLDGTKKVKDVITLSEFTRSRIRKIYGREAHVCRVGVDLEHFKRRVCPELFRRYSGYKIILHIASFVPHSRFNPITRTDLLIRTLPIVMSRIRNVRLLIIKKIDNANARKAIEKLASELGVLDKVEFLPFIDEKLLPCYYSLADVLVQPTQNHSANLPVKEAMACETPVVAFRGDGTEEDIGEDGECGFLVPPLSVDQLALKTIEILENPSLAKEMGKKGRERIKKLFSWEKVANTIWEIINRDVKG